MTVLFGLPFAILALAPGQTHTGRHGHATPAKTHIAAKASVAGKAVPLRSALSTPVVRQTKAPGTVAIVHKATVDPGNYRAGLKAEAIRTASSAHGTSGKLTGAQISELRKAFGNSNLTPLEAQDMQADLTTIRSKPAGSPAVRLAVSSITQRLQYAGVSSTTVQSVQDALNSVANDHKR